MQRWAWRGLKHASGARQSDGRDTRPPTAIGDAEQRRESLLERPHRPSFAASAPDARRAGPGGGRGGPSPCHRTTDKLAEAARRALTVSRKRCRTGRRHTQVLRLIFG